VSPSSIDASSKGITNFVDADDPITFSASRYCKLMVFASTVWAISKILDSARAKPSARRMAACRSPSAFRMADCLFPSATVMAACLVPSASVTTARRVRSADIWRVMASCTMGGGMISRISTFVTFTPHRSVTSSSLARRISFMVSRFASTSSRVMSPTTERSVVAAMFCAAPSKFCTDTTDAAASTTLVNTMKSMEIVALSSVMADWCGISRYVSRRSTRTPRSMIGIRMMSPGPFVPMARPSRNTIMRWYSGTILMAWGMIRISRNRTTPIAMYVPVTSFPSPSCEPPSAPST
jgi:hypothetical protein